MERLLGDLLHARVPDTVQDDQKALMILRALVLRPIVREKMRTALTLLGIAVGVAVVVAIALSNQSALRAFRDSVDAVAGRANWQIASDFGVDERVLLALQPLWPRARSASQRHLCRWQVFAASTGVASSSYRSRWLSSVIETD